MSTPLGGGAVAAGVSQSELLEEVFAYCRIVTALARTIELQQEIDALYPAEVEITPLSEPGGGTSK